VETLKGIKVLVIDDDLDLAVMVAALLESRGARVATAGSGPEALGLLPSFRPDVLVCDINMPECDGYQLMRMVRIRHAQSGLPTAAVALTGELGVRTQTRALLAGFNAHLGKPFDPAELCATVKHVAQKSRESLLLLG